MIKMKNHFDEVAPKKELFEKRAGYYYAELERFFKGNVPPGKRVLEIGCARGSLLKALKPSLAVGVDSSEAMIHEAKKNFPSGNFFHMEAKELKLGQKFDFIILSDTIGHLDDIQKTFEGLKDLSHEDTRVIITYFNYIWQPVLSLAEKLKLKMPEPKQSWLSFDDVSSLFSLSGFSVLKRGRFILLPKNIPWLSYLLNRYVATLPLINHLCLSQYWIARPSRDDLTGKKDRSVSVIVPAKDEKENIAQIVRRMPALGTNTEIIFVEGESKDGTDEEIERIKYSSGHMEIKNLKQDGRGKADAVYKGMDAAKGDVLMILDADMTVAPEELPKFYRVLTRTDADLVMGSRLVYPMEKRAMRFLNLVGNKIFSVMISWIIGRRVKDTLCGTKVLLKETYLRLKENKDLMRLDPFGDFFFILSCSRMDMKIVEIPIRYKERTYGSTKISRFKHGLYLLKMCAVAAIKLKLRI